MFLNNDDDNFTSHFYRIIIVENISFIDVYKTYNLFGCPPNVLDIVLTFIHLLLKENNFLHMKKRYQMFMFF